MRRPWGDIDRRSYAYSGKMIAAPTLCNVATLPPAFMPYFPAPAAGKAFSVYHALLARNTPTLQRKRAREWGEGGGARHHFPIPDFPFPLPSTSPRTWPHLPREGRGPWADLGRPLSPATPPISHGTLGTAEWGKRKSNSLGARHRRNVSRQSFEKE